MAATPLFVPSLAELKAGLRLSGAAQTDTTTIIDNAIMAARIRFYDNLPDWRMTTLIATAYDPAPTTKEGINRVKAALCEIAMVRLQLMRQLPVLFMDGAANARELWNEEELTRNAAKSVEAEIERLEAEIVGYLGDLSANELADNTMNISTIGPAVTPPRPGDSVRPFYGRPPYGLPRC